MIKAAGFVLGELAKISDLYSTTKTHINELAKNSECKVLKKLQAFPFFQFNVIKQYCPIAAVTFISIEEDMLFCSMTQQLIKQQLIEHHFD